MGRGRQKAKQRKVARDLKYYTPDTDYQALERELRAQQKRSDEADDDDEYYEVPPAIDDWDDYDDKSSRQNRRH
ncbi:MAG: DUF3073 domain-containing protein [Ancrocorticia sp.]|jgi:hypothetical protein|nr:DUF3073 domain-containing protein [Ancrocorticia sp.]MCI1933192.1 DUF3073 domain-containing protein [Ancrocorticia sp.]MCI2178116.1 DUF3073 domain-containing protein [Ancrocorticia sp.]MCI2193923.1 DUF3073 domain-containing protein [Ancrocorticia sp.]MCI2198598.1 DUF3073 domain-containing protein [Ancrocorticia sp.]